MDGISRTAGVGPTIQLGGRSLTTNAKILRHYAEMEAEIIRKRGNPFDLIRDAKEALRDCPEIMGQFVTQAFDAAVRWKTVSQQEVHDFLGTMSGTVFAIWLSVRDNDPATITLEWVKQAFMDQMEAVAREQGALAAQKWQAAIEAAIDQASGDDELGNSTGSPQSAAVVSPESAV